MKLIMFDIDGTLTQTDAADGECFVQALFDVFGFTGISDDWSVYPHCTDSGILESIFQERQGHSPSEDEILRFQSWFLSLLEAEAGKQPFLPVAGAWDMLRRLNDMPGVAVSVASGAWECSARLKLASAGWGGAGTPRRFRRRRPCA